MIHDERQLVIPRSVDPLRTRLRSVGAFVVVVDLRGAILDAPPSNQSFAENLVCRARMSQIAIMDAARGWQSDEQPDAVECIPGLWFAPMPIVVRRQRTGYVVAVIPTIDLLESEHFRALCQSAKADYAASRSILSAMQLPPRSEGPRIAKMIRFAHDDQSALGVDKEAAESVGKQLAESYEEISLLYTITQSMTVRKQPERFIVDACEELRSTLPYAWIAAQLADDTKRLTRLAGRLVMAGDGHRMEPAIEDAAEALILSSKPGVPRVVNAGGSNDQRFEELGSNTVVHPISSQGEVIGVLLAGDKFGDDTAATSADMKLMGAAATHMGIFLENATLYEDLNAMFLGTLEALTASIDAKDRYTCGHSRRVAELTRQLAEAIGLDSARVRRMHIAGLVHDVGKIGVPEAVLTKPGKLTDEEFGWVRLHPEMGYRILRDIPQFEDILPGVLYHHEQWNGSGYPHNLKGEQIPLVGRLIALADSFDAMSSNRTYRPRLSHHEVLAEIRRCSGEQFDPGLAAVFVELDFSKYHKLVAEDQRHDAMRLSELRAPIKSPTDQSTEEAA